MVGNNFYHDPRAHFLFGTTLPCVILRVAGVDFVSRPIRGNWNHWPGTRCRRGSTTSSHKSTQSCFSSAPRFFSVLDSLHSGLGPAVSSADGQSAANGRKAGGGGEPPVADDRPPPGPEDARPRSGYAAARHHGEGARRHEGAAEGVELAAVLVVLHHLARRQQHCGRRVGAGLEAAAARVRRRLRHGVGGAVRCDCRHAARQRVWGRGGGEETGRGRVPARCSFVCPNACALQCGAGAGGRERRGGGGALLAVFAPASISIVEPHGVRRCTIESVRL